jgi:hypothetical protein
MKARYFTSIFICLFIFPNGLKAQWSYALRTQYGFLILHHPFIEHLAERHVSMVELSLTKENTGKTRTERIHPKTSWGIAYNFADLGSHTYLGYAHSIFAYMHFPYLVRKNISLNYRLGTGMGFITKPFNRNTNYHNIAIGSYFNETVTMLNEMKIRLSEKTRLNVGMGFTHFSNGTVELPNLGLNLASLFLGLSYYPNQVVGKKDTIPPHKDNTELVVYTNVYLKEDYPVDNKRYFVNTWQVLVSRNTGYKSRWGGGVDVFYDGAVKKDMLTDSDSTNDTKTAVQVGAVASFEAVVGRLSLPLQLGYYVFDNYKRNSIIYQRIGLRYRVTPHIIGNFSLKTHYGSADYFEFGIGYKF